MFPLIAIAAFFTLGILFFTIGKDDFGIKRVKEVSNDSSTQGKGDVNPEPTPNNESIEEKELVSSDSSSENTSTSNGSE